ncbi:MAG: putative ABC exporter domain-containing protein [Acutalibacteraceae bacterium]
MSSTLYLISRKIKNRIKEAFHRPSELILIVVFLALIVFTVFTGNMSENVIYPKRSMDEFYAIVLALYAVVFVLTAKSGFVNGASMFSMADVNLIFTSPKKQTRVLTYGLLSQLGRSLLLGFFILYQYTWAHDSYGISYLDLLIVLVGYGVTVFLSQMLAMLIYSLTSGDDKRNNILKAVFYLVVAAFIVYVAVSAYNSNDGFLAGAVSAASSKFMKFFPVAGFVQLGVVGAVSKNFSFLLISVVCVAAFCALYFLLISLINADYYEDVLKATEVSFSAITARKEGKNVETAPRNVKIGKTGFKKGEGASAIAHKHKIENRRSKFFVLDITAIIMAVVTVAVGWFSHELIAAVVCNVYTLIFTIGTGRWAKELHLPYVYLIPEPPFKKLLYMLKEQFPAFLAEGIITFVPFYFIFSLSVPETASLVAVRVSFSFMFIGINLLLSRIFGSSDNKTLVVFLYFLLAMVFSVPGIVGYIVMSNFFMLGMAVSYLTMTILNTVVAFVLIFVCRNILACAEYNNK